MLSDKCKLFTGGFCDRIGRHVMVSFCKNVCNGKGVPKKEIAPNYRRYCVPCECYRKSCKVKEFCVMLTRYTNLSEHWENNKECPLDKWPDRKDINNG